MEVSFCQFILVVIDCLMLLVLINMLELDSANKRDSLIDEGDEFWFSQYRKIFLLEILLEDVQQRVGVEALFFSHGNAFKCNWLQTHQQLYITLIIGSKARQGQFGSLSIKMITVQPKVDSLVKREDQADIAFESLLRAETIEGQTLYIVSQLLEHPLMQKMSFSFGQLHLYFESTNKITCYHGELDSIKCLNNDIDWDSKYFDKIAAVFSTGGKEFNYSFKTDDTNIFKITEKIQILNNKKTSNATEATILKVAVKPAPHFATLDHLIQLVQNRLKRHTRKVTELNTLLEKVDLQKKQMFIEIEKINFQHKEREETLINQFVLLLNEKKKKIRDIETRAEQQMPYAPKKNKDQMQEEKQSYQQQQIITSSQYGMSQPVNMGTLFEPSLPEKTQVKIEKEEEGQIHKKAKS